MDTIQKQVQSFGAHCCLSVAHDHGLVAIMVFCLFPRHIGLCSLQYHFLLPLCRTYIWRQSLFFSMTRINTPSFCCPASFFVPFYFSVTFPLLYCLSVSTTNSAPSCLHIASSKITNHTLQPAASAFLLHFVSHSLHDFSFVLFFFCDSLVALVTFSVRIQRKWDDKMVLLAGNGMLPIAKGRVGTSEWVFQKVAISKWLNTMFLGAE